jgi:predicted aminopeptidase
VSQYSVFFVGGRRFCSTIRDMRTLACLVLVVCLTGCDVVGTTAATATGASAEVKQAQDAKRIEEQVRQQVQLDVQQNKSRTEQAEKDAQ